MVKKTPQKKDSDGFDIAVRRAVGGMCPPCYVCSAMSALPPYIGATPAHPQPDV